MDSGNVKQVLIISSTGMGDALWGTPALRALKASFPNLKIHFLVDRRWVPLFWNNPWIDRLLVYQKQWYRQLGLQLRLALESYDRILIFHANKDFRRILQFKSHDGILAHQQFDWLAAERKIQLPDPTHGIQKRLEMIQRIGVRPVGGQMEIFFSAEEEAAGRAALERLNLAPGEYLYLNVGVSAPNRRWPPDQFAALAELALEQTNWKIVLGGGPLESAAIGEIAARLDPARVATTVNLGFKKDCFLIGRAKAMVTGNTGPMHVGFALETPTVAMHFVTDPRHSGAFEIPDERHAVLQPEGPDPEVRLDRGISVSRVWENAQRLTKKK